MMVLIKSWNRMKNQYGLNSDGNIDCEMLFTSGMMSFCETVIEIKEYEHHSNYKEAHGFTLDGNYSISNSMIDTIVTRETHPEHFL